MNDLVAPVSNGIAATDWREKYRGMDAAQLKTKLLEVVQSTVEGIRETGRIVVMLEEMGDDLSDLRFALIDYYKRIAHGQLAPEALLAFGDNRSLLRKVAALPIDEQQRLARGGTVKLVAFLNGERTSLCLPLSKLEGPQIKQVFGRDGIRDEGAQNAFLAEKERKARLPKKESVGQDRVDHDLNGAYIGRHFRSLAELEGLVKALRKRA